MATAVYTGSTAPGAAATGYSGQGHIVYAPNQGAWWWFFLTSDFSGAGLGARYSTDGTTINTPTGSPYQLRAAHGSEGRNYGFSCTGISTYDVLHMNSAYSGNNAYHSRFTLGTTWTNTDSEASWRGSIASPAGSVTGMDGSNNPWNETVDSSYYLMYKGNTDSGSSWTAGFSYQNYYGSGAASGRCGIIACGSNLVEMVTYSGGTNTITDVADQIGTSGSLNAISSTITSTFAGNYGYCLGPSTTLHWVFLSNNSNTFLHKLGDGVTNTTGNSIPGATHVVAANSGIALVSDGVDVWAWYIDNNSGSYSICYCKWTAATTTWDSTWTALETGRSNSPAYITAAINPTGPVIQVAWTELNGSNYEIWTSQLSFGAASSTGTGAATLAELTGAGSGGFLAPGSGTATLAELIGASAGGFLASGSGAITLAELVGAGSGGFFAPGSGTATLDALTGAGSGEFLAAGTGTATLVELVGSGTGSAVGGDIVGTGAATLVALAGAGVGGFLLSGTGTATLAVLTGAGTGGFEASSTGSVTLEALTAAGAATAAIAESTGTGSATLATLAASGSGQFSTTGAGAARLTALIAAGVSGHLYLYLPYEFTSVVIVTGTVNPFDIDPDQTVPIEIADTNPFDVDSDQTILIIRGLTD